MAREGRKPPRGKPGHLKAREQNKALLPAPGKKVTGKLVWGERNQKPQVALTSCSSRNLRLGFSVLYTSPNPETASMMTGEDG